MKVRQKKDDVRAFRCDSVIIEKAMEKADSLGMNLSEYIRVLILKDLELIGKKS